MTATDPPDSPEEERLPPPPSAEALAASRWLGEAGWDPTVVLCQLRRGSLLAPDMRDDLTSIYDFEELRRAAREELRRAQRRGDKMANSSKAELARQALEVGEEDQEDGITFADKIGAMMRASHFALGEVTIEYRDLRVEADALVGTAGIPSLGNVAKGLLKRALCQGGLQTTNLPILRGMHGVLRPGTVTLLLGPPGAGKTVFLQTLAGRMQGKSGVRVSGSIKFNGQPASELVVQRTVAYVDQLDYHIPNLTCLETCQFAHDCLMNLDKAAQLMAGLDALLERLGRDADLQELEAEAERDAEAGQAGAVDGKGGEPAAVGGASSKRLPGDHVFDAKFVAHFREVVKHRAKPHIVLKLLGLSDVADTVVGDAMKRGISGGQRKRVTTGEILCGPASAIMFDEISTGLDSATTYSVIKSFWHVAHAMRRTFVISLLQPPPEVVDLFDDILLLTDGHVVFHGPVGEILPFFEQQLSFVCPVRKDKGSFLQEVTTPVGQYAYATPELLTKRGLTEAARDPLRLLTAPPKVLLTPVEEMEAAFYKGTPWGRDLLESLDQRPFKPEDGPPGSLFTTPYANSMTRLTKLVLKRQFLLNSRDRAFYIARTMQAVVIGLIVASLFAPIDVSSTDGRQVLALASLSGQTMAMMSMPQIGLVFSNKRAYFKQRDARFFAPFSYVLSFNLTQLPISTMETLLFSLVVYWITGLYRSAGNFFTWLVVVWSVSNCMAGFYRLIAYAVPSMIVANATGGLMILFLMVTNGFSITAGSIPSWLKWIYWINPLAWTLRALVTNELNSPRWDVPSGVPGVSMGQAVAQSFDFQLGAQWIWGSVGLCWGSLVLYSIAGALALRWTDPPAPQPTVSEEKQKEEVQRSALSMLQRVSMTHRSPSQPGSGRLSPLPSARAEEAAAAAVAVPFTPITLVCRNIRYYVPDPSKGAAPGVVKDSSDPEIEGKLELLKGISLYAEPGSLTALMGGSGAGKTTLMDVILGRKTVGLVRGDILVNGHAKQQDTWSRVCGYVEQQDIHSPGSTVREALVFSARLRLDGSIGWDKVNAIVDNALETCDLTVLAGNIVGEPGGAGLSVEQRKRLSIGVELVANPSVVFMDEPTSGLDARAAAIVMRAVKNVSLSNRTVMVTIHQPSMDIFEQFTELVLLQRGGRTTYFGPLGDESEALIKYLEAQPGVEPIKSGYNPATWMLEVTGGSMSTTFKNSGQDFPTLYQESELRKRNEARMEELAAQGAKEHQPLSLANRYAASYSTQRTMLLKKFFIQYWRNPNYNAVRFFMTTCIGLILGLVYLGQGDLGDGSSTSVSTVQNIMGLTFVLTIFQGMFNCMTVQPVMAAERTVFYRERAAMYYSAVPYAMATGVVELPYLLVQAILMVLVTTYWMVGYQIVFWKVALYFLLYFLSLTMFTYFGQLLTFATPNQLLAQLLSGFINQLWSLFAGFMVPYPVMPAGWKWMNRISPTTWILYGLAGSQLCDRDIPMEGFNGPTTVSEFMKSAFGYEQDMVWWCVLIVFAFCLVFRVFAMVVLAKVNFQKR